MSLRAPTIAFVLLVLALAALTAACSSGNADPTASTEEAATAAAAPVVFSPPSETAVAPLSVTLSCATAGATICYTTTGANPTCSAKAVCGAADHVYQAGHPVVVSSSGDSIKALACKKGLKNSAVKKATYELEAAPVTFNPPTGTLSNDASVMLATTTAGATICYTTTGTPPTCVAGVCGGPALVYAGQPIAVTRSGTTISAIACETGLLPSAVTTATYTLDVASVTFNPPPGTLSNDASVTLATQTAGATICYTTTGVPPTCVAGVCGGPALVYAGQPIAVTLSDTTISAIACESGFLPSAVTTGTYVLDVATPVANPPFGTYPAPLSVSLSTVTAGATLCYSTNGVPPNCGCAGDTVYQGPFTLAAGVTQVQAIACEAGFQPSNVAAWTYDVTP